jgi:hypothetical protein
VGGGESSLGKSVHSKRGVLGATRAGKFTDNLKAVNVPAAASADKDNGGRSVLKRR